MSARVDFIVNSLACRAEMCVRQTSDQKLYLGAGLYIFRLLNEEIYHGFAREIRIACMHACRTCIYKHLNMQLPICICAAKATCPSTDALGII
jgi:hypothetical protein